MPRLNSSVWQNIQSLLVALACTAVVTACSPDALTRDSAPDRAGVVQSSAIGDADLVALVEADLTCLYSKAGLLPNESSSLGKFRTVVTSVLAGDLATAQTDADKLIKFIELKYSQYSDQNGTVDCGPPIGIVNITTLKERVVARINAYVTLGGNVCEIPDGSPETFCKTADEQTAIVYFPPGIFKQLTYVSVEENPPGFTRLQNLGFDEYPTYVRVITEPISDFSGELVKPLVYVCFTTAEQEALFTLDRLRLGHRHTATDGTVSFKLLPTPDFGAYDPEVRTQVEDFCNTQVASTSFTPFDETNLLARLGNRIANFLAPAPLQASLLLAGTGGIGGSAEEFSEFGAVDRGFSGTGGVGGSAEEFSRAGAVEGMASATVSGDGTTITGKVGVDNNVTDPAQLPSVRVISPATGSPIAGVKVFFALSNPVTAPYKDSPSAASLCGASEAVTDANGQASPPCLNFGNTVGFKNLKVTFDPTPVDALACIVDDATGACASGAKLNFLIATIAGDPAKLAVVNAPVGATSARAGFPMDAQPILQVQDAGGNPVTNLAADVPVTVTVTKADGTVGGSVAGLTNTTDKALGKVSFSSLALGGTVGTTYRLTFTSGALTGATADVTVSAPGAASGFTVAPATASAQAGGLIPTITATVTDAFGNAVSGIAVTVAAADVACFSAATGCTTATSDAAGKATFSDLTIQGAGASRTLSFTATGLTSQSVALTLTPGAASQIVAFTPAGGAYGSGLPIATVSPNPTAKVTDAFGNAVANASVLWQLQSTTNGATVSLASTSTASNGTTSVTWTLGDGDNGLKAYLGSTATYAQFTAATATGGVTLSCDAGSKTRKIDLSTYNAAINGYQATFSMQPELAARFRSLRLFMSVTGQSSGTGDYPATVKVYRGSKSLANLIATGAPANPTGVIQLDGNNGSFAPVDFTLTPVATSSVAQAGNNNFVLIEVTVEAPSTRTLQVWYNQPAGGGTCGSTFLYAPGVTNFLGAASRDKTPGILIRVRN